MTPEELYQIARRHCYNSPHKDDIIQDAVFRAWMIFSERQKLVDQGLKSPDTLSYIRDCVVKDMRDAFRYYSRRDRYSGGLDFTDLQDSLPDMSYYDQILSIPLTGRKREVAEAMINGNFELDVAAKTLGFCKSNIHYWWKKALKELKLHYEME